MRQRLLTCCKTFNLADTQLRLLVSIILLFGATAVQAQNSDIIPKASFTAPANVAYGSYQAANIVGDATSLVVAGFTLRDGGAAAPDGDNKVSTITDLTFSLSNSANIQRVALYAADQTTELAEVAGSATPTFTGLTISAADDGTVDFYIRVTFNSTVTDNQQYQFAVTAVTDAPGGSSITGFGTASSSIASNDNKIIVTASKFRFVQGPSNTLAGVNMTPAVTVEAVDALNNRDLNFATSVDITSSGTLSSSPQSATFASGLGTYSTINHTASGTGLTLTATNGVLTDAASGTFNITNSNTSNIVLDGTFTHPSNVAYASFQENADIQNTGTSVNVTRFKIQDGGGAADGDAVGTTLTALTLDLGANWAYIRRIALYDAAGTGEIAGTEQAVSGQTVNFAGLTLTAADGGSMNFTVRVSFTTAVVDNGQFNFTITSATSGSTSTFAAANAGGAVSSNASNDNKIEVTATKFAFVQAPTDALAGVNMTPAVTVEAIDANNLRDLDFATSVGITSSGTLSSSPQNATFASGLGTYSSINHTAVGTGLTLTASNGSLTNAVSGTFNITSSNISDIILDAGFTHPSNIAYSTSQEAANIQNTATSRNVTRFQIRDGGGAADGDGVGTSLTALTLDLGANWGYIRRIALYDAAGTTEIGSTEQAVSAQTVNFSGFTAITAADGGTMSFTVRVSFTTAVTDNGQFNFTITSATAGTTSTFAAANAGGAVSSNTGDANRIEVTATKLLFVQNSSNTEAGVAMSPSPTVEAVDANNKRDLDFGADINITSNGTLSSTPQTATASSGLSTFSTITHTAVGTGRTLTAASAGLTSGASNTFNITGSALSDIIATPSYVYTTNIAYTNFDSNSSTDVTSGTSTILAKFDLRDGGGATDNDGLSTTLTNLTLDLGANWAMIRRVALYNSGGTEYTNGDVAVSGQTVSFSSLTIAATDGNTTTISVRVMFQASTAVDDNATMSFTVTSATAGTSGSTFAAANAGGATTDVTGDNNKIEVTATKLVIVQDASTVNVNDAMSPDPSAEATDGNNNRDLDFVANVNLTSSGTLNSTPQTVAAVAGLATFSNIIHTAAAANKNLSFASAGLTGASGGNFDIIAVSTSSQIELNGSFTYPTNIDYISKQETDIVSGSLDVVGLTLRDGNGSNDADNKATTLNSLTVSITNSGLLRKVALFDGTTQLDEQTAGPTVVFSGFTLTANDNSTNNFTIKASFQNTGITDNQQFSFTITNATTAGGTSGFAASNAGGVTSLIVGDNNKIEVTASKYLFVQQPSNVSNGVAMSPSPTVEAVDANNFRDLDFTSNIGLTSTGTMTGSPQTVAAVSGLATFTNIVHTLSQTARTLSTNHGTPAWNTTSNTFDIGAANNSDIIANAAYVYPQNIAYVNYQENANIDAMVASSVEVAKFDVRDGGGSNDGDTQPTVLTNVTLDLGSNFGYIRRVAIYDAAGTTELGEQAVVGQTVAFGGLTVSAADNTSASFTVRVSFTTAVVDNQQFTIAISAATAQGGGNSGFAAANAGGAITSTASNNNRIEVITSKLLFVQQPSNTVAGVAMSPTPTIEAVDANNHRDLDESGTVGLTTSGTLSTSPSATFASGLGTYSAVTHSAAGMGIQLTTSNVFGWTDATSNSFDVIAAQSDIIANTSFTYTDNIDYRAYQENTNLTSANSLKVAMFDIRDGGAGDADTYSTTLTDLTLDLGSNYTYIRRIALYDATGTSEIGGTEQAVSSQTVNFTGLTLTAADDGTTSFVVRVSFTTAVTDNQYINFTVSSATSQTGNNSRFGTANAGGATASTVGDNNKVEVTATALAFVQGVSNVLNGIAMSPAVTARAIDDQSKTDLDYTGNVTLTSTGSLAAIPSANFVAGIGTYSSIIHNLNATGRTLSTNSGSLSNTISGTFDITSSSSSDIIANALFAYPTNIDYASYQESADLTLFNSLQVANFTVRDGGGSNDADGASTILNAFTLDLGSNYGFIRRIALYVGGVEISDQAVSSQTVNFSALSISASDNSSVGLQIMVSFTTAVTDNQQFAFSITSATSNSFRSTFATANAGGASTSTAGDNNRIEVFATQLRFLQQPTNTLVNVGMTPSPTVEARDWNDVRDLDNATVVTLGTMGSFGPGPNPTASLSAGFGTFSTVTHSAAATSIWLYTNNSDGLAETGSVVFDVIAKSSTIAANTSFITPTNVAYNTFQENTNIQNTATSVVVAKFDILDGGPLLNDGDPFGTTLTNLSLNLGANYTYIRRIALYDATGTTEIAGTEQAVSAQTVNFAGLTLSASDNSSASFTVRVSFTTAVVDNQQYQFTISSATAQTGNSEFAAANAGGAVSSIAGNNNRIEVTASKLLFIQQPSNVLNGIAMTPAVTVEAVDPLNLRDLDFTANVAMTSNGTMNATSVNFIAGLGTYSNIIHTLNANGRALTTSNVSGLTNATSGTFNITSSSGSNIIANTSFAYPTNIAYHNYQEATDLTNSTTSLIVAKYDVQDGGNSLTDADGAPTELTALTLDLGANFNRIRRIALYDALGTTEIAGTDQIVSAQTVNFSGFTLSAADGGVGSFTVRVSFTTNVIDNEQFNMTITSATSSQKSLFAAGNAGGAVSSNAGDNNRIEVTATQYVFTTPPTSTVFVNIPFASPLVVQAQDGNGRLDLDYGASVFITNASNIPMTDNAGHTSLITINVPFASGVLNFDANFRYDNGGDGTLTIKNNLITPTISKTSNTVTVQVSTSSDIVEASFNEPDNITHLDYRATDINLASAGDEIQLAAFTLRDGGASNDVDAAATELTSITFQITNYSFIKRLALYTGSNEIAEATVTSNTVTFSGLSGVNVTAADNGTKSLILYATFNDLVTDNQQVSFQITNVTSNPAFSGFAATNGGGAASNLSQTDDNRIEVTATQIDFTTFPSPANASISVPFAMTVTAVDAASSSAHNPDLDFVGTITAFSNTSAFGFVNGPNVGSTTFTAGQYVFSNFNFTSGNAATTIQITAGGINGNSPSITVISSYDSYVYNYQSTLNIQYKDYQAATIGFTSNSGVLSLTGGIEVQRYYIIDGGYAGWNGSKYTDADGAPTTLEDITFGISNPQSIRSIAIFEQDTLTDVWTKTAEQAGSAITPTTGYGFITFDNVNLQADDGQWKHFVVAVSFNNTSATITDNSLVQVVMTGATNTSGGSKFRGDINDPVFGPSVLTPGNTTDEYIGGFQKTLLANALAPAGTYYNANFGTVADHTIEVIATSLDFTTPPVDGVNNVAKVVGISHQFATQGVIEARDDNEIVDKDYDAAGAAGFTSLTLSTPGAGLPAAVSTISFSQGIATLPLSFQYSTEGIGTLLATANKVGGGTINSNQTDPSEYIDVIHTTFSLIPKGVGGVITNSSLKGGSFSKVIFGVTFNRDYATATEPNLQSFKIRFSNTINNVLTGVKVYETLTPNFQATTPVPVVIDPSGLFLTVNLTSGGGKALTTATPSRSYFLVVDIQKTASSTTPKIQPSVKDIVYDPAAVSGNDVVMSKGSAVGDATGQEYNFAATTPPELIDSYPAVGQRNISVDQKKITLGFDRGVKTLNKEITLWRQDSTTGPATQICKMAALNGMNSFVEDLEFEIPNGTIGYPLDSNVVYFVTVDPDVIEDENNNKFGGIDYSGTLYFRTTNGLAPKIVYSTATTANNPVVVDNTLPTAAVVSVTFDQPGRAYYLVTNQGDAEPTLAQIKAPGTYPTTVTSNNADITATEEVAINFLIQGLTPNKRYRVYMYAEGYSELDGVKTAIPNDGYFMEDEASYIPQPNGDADADSATFRLNTPATGALSALVLNRPAYSVCANSEVTLTAPIIIAEGQVGAFNAGSQYFYLVLPSGFQFTSKAGQITCTGGDFVGTGGLNFLNNSILEVSFNNSGSSNFDFISITGLTIQGSASGTLNIQRLGGNALISTLPDLTALATISTFDDSAPEFTNTYSLQEFPEWDDEVGDDDDDTQFVNYIPFDYAANVELIPIRKGDDYGPNTFSGTGVSVNKLGLDNDGFSFNVTMSHTDNNGCLSTNVQQYFVYNPYELVRYSKDSLQTLASAYTFENREFPGAAVADEGDTITLKYNRFDGYFLYDLQLDIPTDGIGGPINADSALWVDLIKNNWAVNDENLLSGDEIYRDLNVTYDGIIEPRNFHLPYKTILDATIAGSPSYQPYDKFKDFYINPETQLDSAELPYYTGGLLGRVLLTARYQNSTNSAYQIPIRIPIDIYLPARPIVVAEDWTNIEGDTVAIFCKAAPLIPITAWPQPVQDVSSATFSLWDMDEDEAIDISALPEGAFTDNGNGTASLDPSKFDNSHHTIRIDYEYDLFASPGTDTAYHYIRISPNPKPLFTFGNECEDTDVPFVSVSESGNPSDPNDPNYPITGWEWNFGDITSGAANDVVGTDVPTHDYAEPDSYTVSLTATNFYGCESVTPATSLLVIARTPVAAFKLSGVAEDVPFTFDAIDTDVDGDEVGELGLDSKKDYEWTFGDGSAPVPTQHAIEGTTITHTYATAGRDSVRLIVTSTKGCIDSVKQMIVVLPSFIPDVDTNYEEDFAAGDAGWEQLGIKGTSGTSWNWDAAKQLWTTENTTKFANEQSALYSVAFDLTQLDRPILIFNDSVNFGNNAGDGVVIEYSTDTLNIVDPAKKWNRLGDGQNGLQPASGINWYNASNLAGKPGTQPNFDYGWTGTREWTASKHNLSGIPVDKRGTVVFRFAYGSVFSELTTSGFMLDDLRLGNGTRTVLLESFTNTSSWDATDYQDFKEFVNDKLGDEVVKIDYHVSFPNIDPFNQANQSDPGARALYYNISAVPQVCLDGMVPEDIASGRPNQDFASWSTYEFNKRVLELSDATIEADIDLNADGEITVSGTFKPLKNMPDNTILHIAVIEEAIPVDENENALSGKTASDTTTFAYVLRKLLPSASGIKYNNLISGTEYTFGDGGELKWSNPSLFLPQDDIAVVVFLQDEETKTIYQSRIYRGINDPAGVTGINDPEFAMNFYPNPSDKEFTVELAKPVKDRTPLVMYDQLGHVVTETVFERGESSKKVNTTTLSGGVYLIKIDTPDGSVIKKMMVMHKN